MTGELNDTGIIQIETEKNKKKAVFTLVCKYFLRIVLTNIYIKKYFYSSHNNKIAIRQPQLETPRKKNCSCT